MDGSHDSVLVSKVPMLKPNEFDMWKIRIRQYILLTDYSMWDIIENENGTSNVGEIGADGKRPPPKTDGERKMRQTEIKALSTLLLAIPNEYQHQFCNCADAKILWNALEKRFSVSAAYGLKHDGPNDSVLEAFLASHAKSSLINDDLDQINVDDLEKVYIKWQMAMLTMRIKRFIKRTGRNNFAMRREDGAGFDKSKVECYKNSSQALVSQDGMGFDWSDQADEAIQNQALMAEVSESSSTTIPTAVKSKLCSKACLETVRKYRDHNQSMCDDLKRLEKHRRESNLIIVNFEEQIKAYQANELQHSYDHNYWKWEKKELDIKLEKAREECEKFRSEFEKAKLDIEKISNDSKAMDTLLKSQVHEKLKRGIGYNNTPPPYNNNYIPPTSDLLERQDKNDLPAGATKVDPLDNVVVEVESEEENTEDNNKEDQKEIPLEYHILTNEKGVNHLSRVRKLRPLRQRRKRKKSKQSRNHMADNVRTTPMKTGIAKSYIQNKFVKAKENTPRKSRSNSKNRKANNFVKIWVPKDTKPVSTATSNSTANRNSVADSNTTADQVSTANKGNQQLKGKSIWHVDSGCSRHMTGNMSCLQNFKRFDGGRVAFGDNPAGDVMSIGKKSYCLVIVDDFSRFTWVYFLRTKDETNGLIKSFVLMIENQTNLRVKVIRSDNGTEFKDSDLNSFCETKGIERQFSAPRTPQQNGVADRRNRTLIEATRSLLADSKQPITFWEEAVNTACKSEDGFLVGYFSQSKAYGVFNSSSRIIEESDNVKCNENTPNQIGTGTSSAMVQAQRQEFVLFPIPTVDPVEYCHQEKKDVSGTEDSESKQGKDAKGDEKHKGGKEDAHSSGSGNTGPEMPILSGDDTDDENSSVFGGNTPEKNDSNLDENINEEAVHQTRT
ncbi:hypothetical protein L6452_34627 [Arctium lappa]|uniref:Uncharacterized protein n=1 Tax=Arctium lappa TaxID=4217 RepID=A0ACB8YIS1_ARCLA|nr:hypothetical protein L6452_34627 [Arctium lappa]